MNCRKFLSWLRNALVNSSANAAHGQVWGTGITADKIRTSSLSAISVQITDATIRNATIGPLSISASNIEARSITAERTTL